MLVKLGESEPPRSVVLRFVEAINAGNSEVLKQLQTGDFKLIDMAGEVFRGRSGWEDYFSANPDYRIHIQHILTGGSGVALIGRTTGSHLAADIEAKETVLWTAEVRKGLVAEWRIYSTINATSKQGLASD